MECLNCGYTEDTDSLFCRKCGENLSRNSLNFEINEATQDKNIANQETKEDREIKLEKIRQTARNTNKNPPNISNPRSHNRPGLISQLWRGEISLGITYWLFGVVAPLLASLIIPPAGKTLGALLGSLAIAYMVFINIAVWRSANNKKTNKFWGTMAKSAIALSIAAAIVGVLTAAIIGKKHYPLEPSLATSASAATEHEPPPYQYTPTTNTQSKPAVTQNPQPNKNEEYTKAVRAIEDKYKVLNPRSSEYSQEAVDETLKYMNTLISHGYSPALAVLKASDQIGPLYTQQNYVKQEQPKAKEFTPPPQQSQEQESKKSTEKFLPPVQDENACVYKTVMTDEEIAKCRTPN